MARKLLVSFLGALVLVIGTGCEKAFGVKLTNPSRVVEFSTAERGLGSATLAWTQVSDGGQRPANYLLFVGSPPTTWPVTNLSEGTLVTGTAVGAPLQYTVSELQRASVYSAYVVAFRQTDDSVFFGPASNTVSFTTEASDPSVVGDLEASALGTSAVQLRWTEVEDGAGRPAAYLLAFGKQPVNWTSAEASATRIEGTAIGGLRDFGVSGLDEGATYDFRIASVRDSVGSLAKSVSAFTPTVSATTETPPVTAVAPFFQDGFDNGAKSNANGFSWGSATNRVSVSTDRPFSGTHSLKFRFGPDTTNGDSNAEQRFNLGKYVSGYWVEFMLYIPTNFVHRGDSPGNNKFFVTWRDTYSDVAGGTWRIGYEYRGSSSTSLLRPMSSRWDFNSWTDQGLNHPQNGAPFIGGTGPIRIGQWNRIRLQFQAASSRTASDGIMQMWVNDALYASKTDGKFHNFNATPVDAVLRNGYFLGWSNSGFTQETSLFIDNVRFFDQNPGW